MTISRKSVLLLGDRDTAEHAELLAARAAECGTHIAETHTFEPADVASADDLGEVDAVVTVLCRAVRTHSNIWVPFPLDLIREEHLRRISLVLQRHGLNLFVGYKLWACPRNSGVNEVDCALRKEVRAVDQLDNAVLAAAGMVTLRDEIQAALQVHNDQSARPSGPLPPRLPDVLQELEVQYGPHPGLPATRAAWAVRRPALKRFAYWLVHSCGLTRAEAADFLNTWGHTTQSGRNWQRSTVSTLINR